MNMEVIGNNILKLRKERGATQEELGKYVCVSPQAVSKWENGGVPDAELLPKIADFFSVSIDALFGRNVADYAGLEQSVANSIANLPKEERIQSAFELCKVIQSATRGKEDISANWTLENFKKEYGERRLGSTTRYDSGYSLVGLSEDMPYFFIAPEPADRSKALLEGIDYPAFFAILADEDVFNTILLLYKRENNSSLFTSKLLLENLDLTTDKAEKILSTLKELHIVTTISYDVDDSKVEFFAATQDPAFITLLTFAREVIVWDKAIIMHSYRNKPYLN